MTKQLTFEMLVTLSAAHLIFFTLLKQFTYFVLTSQTDLFRKAMAKY